MYNSIKNIVLQIRTACLILAILMLAGGNIMAQWINNPQTNTKLVTGVVNPSNISAVEDLKGGAFILWEDNKSGTHKDIYYLHIDNNGKPDFRADGKTISQNRTDKEHPVALTNLPGYVVAIWRDLAGSKKNLIEAQKLSSDGSLVWSKDVQVTLSDMDVKDFAGSSDSRGNSYISFITKEKSGGFSISLQKLSPAGVKLFEKKGTLVNDGDANKLNCEVVADFNGGAYVLWLESVKARTILQVQHVDSLGLLNWGSTPLSYSVPNGNIINFNARIVKNGSLYVAWQAQTTEKKVYHELITSNGKNAWYGTGKAVSSLKGNQTNPQVLPTDSSLIVSWTYEGSGNKDVYIQNFSFKGYPLWTYDGIPVIEMKGDQFGQKLLSDNSGGAVVCWIDRRLDSVKANIYAQRVAGGKLSWNPAGIPLATYYNTEKSYLNVIPDGKGGAIAFFKEKRKDGSSIYGQKVFNTGSYISQISNVDLQIEGDSIKVGWQVENPSPNSVFDVERSYKEDTQSSGWQIAATVKAKAGVNYYQLYDTPGNSGAVYYRITQKDSEKNTITSDVKSINFFKGAGNIVVGQNVPNPFKGKTKIIFYLPQSAHVKIEFFNNQVQKVHEINETFKSGENEVYFDGTGLPEGIYFYRFQSGSFTDVKKMMINK